ncbi:uncharacterized protein LOC130825952 [Amaranthus tricolor]|uniref:uncharacterized protein LOC130825952 n=1 Tax=Amaranthus tricolor TaxID=29722 RepID=UPI0025834342|nr:uncharacterized protein LOC130825952 [Amaranthus tricolor]XP_057547388.1 uncharacterized protein LOC130825952 [Amaranthus tricolor]
MPMACQVIIRSWTLSTLVGAFLDLAIAFFLLCSSAVAFFLAKFLAFFGLTLPCPCNGFFGVLTRQSPCLQRLLLDFPTNTISSVQLSVKTKFPFDSILARNQPCQLNFKLLRETISDGGVLELEGEASCSCCSDSRSSQHTLSASNSFGEFDIKTKTAATQRPRVGLRRGRRESIQYGILTSSSSYDHLRSDTRAIPRSTSDPSILEVVENSTLFNFHERTVPDFESHHVTDENKLIYENAISSENLKNNLRLDHGHGVDGEAESAIRILELALEEEQAARVALCTELEKERLAAATAADETMAMISRLQEEKASIEIAARQYQRIIEEKSIYDAEEMDILKEIIVRREREKHFLEKEVEAYRKVFQENSGLDCQSNITQGQNEGSIIDFSADPMLILQQLSESIDKRRWFENMSNYPSYTPAHVRKQISTLPEGKESSILQPDHDIQVINEPECSQRSSIIPGYPHSDDETIQDVQEKGMLSTDKNTYPQLCESSSSQGKNSDVYPQQRTICDVVKPSDGEPHVHDVYIIDSKSSVSKNTDEMEDCQLLMHNNAYNVARKHESPLWSSDSQKFDGSADKSLKVELEINRSSSDIVDRFPTASSSPDRSFVSDLRRNTLSVVDLERLKIDSEIGWLRARLRAVQEEKDKLKSSLEHREKGKNELQLLEDIAGHIEEIHHLTTPEKAARQASLPPLSDKATSKKRRSRSVSQGVGRNDSS